MKLLLPSALMKYSACMQHVCLCSCRCTQPYTFHAAQSPAFMQFWVGRIGPRQGHCLTFTVELKCARRALTVQ